MGYYTHYSLSYTGATATEVVAAFKKHRNYFGFEDEKDLVYQMKEPAKWYDHNDDMLAVSTLLPGATLTLDGEGEEQGDVWRKVYRDGKIVQRQKARLAFDDGEEV